VRREVYDREGGSCAYVGEGDRRCCSTLRLEYQHIVPVARGGESTPQNLTLFCRSPEVSPRICGGSSANSIAYTIEG
jgi:5-methylcytosine-specific restriction endonuclease McrA